MAWLMAFIAAALLMALGVYGFFYFERAASDRLAIEEPRHQPRPPALVRPSALLLASLPSATRWDAPLGSPRGAFSYNAQRFGENDHLGEDLNGIGGKDTDWGDPVFAAARGVVWYARDGGPGWGNVLMILHAVPEGERRRPLISFYGHLEEILVAVGEPVERGQLVGTVGDAGGRYYAHLHFELREVLGAWAGVGYRPNKSGWIPAAPFLRSHRGAADSDFQGDIPFEAPVLSDWAH